MRVIVWGCPCLENINKRSFLWVFTNEKYLVDL